MPARLSLSICIRPRMQLHPPRLQARALASQKQSRLAACFQLPLSLPLPPQSLSLSRTYRENRVVDSRMTITDIAHWPQRALFTRDYTRAKTLPRSPFRLTFPQRAARIFRNACSRDCGGAVQFFKDRERDRRRRACWKTESCTQRNRPPVDTATIVLPSIIHNIHIRRARERACFRATGTHTHAHIR